MIILADNARHLVCFPYSVRHLHLMAEYLGIGRHFYHTQPFPHYDIPIRRQAEITAWARPISSRHIVRLWRNQPHCHPENGKGSHVCCPACPISVAAIYCSLHSPP